MVLISLQVRETVRSRAFFLFSFVFSQGVLLQHADIALGPATPAHHPLGGFICFLVVCLQQSRVTRLHHVRCTCFRSTSSVHAGCGLEQVFIGTIQVRDEPDEEYPLRRRTRMKTMMKSVMCRDKKTNDLERERGREREREKYMCLVMT